MRLHILFVSLLLVGFGCRTATPPPVPEPEPPPSETGDPSRLMPPLDPGMSLYTNSQHDLMLEYPSRIVPLTDPEAMTAMGYIPACDPENAVVCFPIPQSEYPGTNFSNAAFSIRLRLDLKTEAACMTADNGEVANGQTTISETTFHVFAFGDAAMSHQLNGKNYRAFREGGCYELATRIATTTYEVYEEGTIRRFTDEDRAAVEAILDRMRSTFRFQDDLELL